MKVYDDLEDKKIPKEGRGIAIGIFDGVHRGHQRILNSLVRECKKNRRKSMVLTFDPHPNKVLRPKTHHPILMSLSHRLCLMERLGIDEVLAIRFDRKISQCSADHFLKNILIHRLAMQSLTLSWDFCFGRGGEGNHDYLQIKAHELGFDLHFVYPLRYRGAVISSTRIRRLVERGHLCQASAMLGRPVSVRGDVIHGHGRGGPIIGYPTANIDPHHETLPPDGIYAAWGWVSDKKIKGVIHIGPRPTFNEKKTSLEVYFLNFHNDLYGKEIELFFVKKIRPIKKFNSAKALTKAIAKDVADAKRILK